ncbi:hypothetical protein B5X24_HaOG207243 [Helicoverpa armigera]|nr:hypothetical protein B5X24_HaOG207243 [Helicoverpa armigera]
MAIENRFKFGCVRCINNRHSDARVERVRGEITIGTCIPPGRPVFHTSRLYASYCFLDYLACRAKLQD